MGMLIQLSPGAHGNIDVASSAEPIWELLVSIVCSRFFGIAPIPDPGSIFRIPGYVFPFSRHCSLWRLNSWTLAFLSFSNLDFRTGGKYGTSEGGVIHPRKSFADRCTIKRSPMVAIIHIQQLLALPPFLPSSTTFLSKEK